MDFSVSVISPTPRSAHRRTSEPETTQTDPPEQPEVAPPEPSPKRRGRPPGSRNKPKIIEQIPEQPIVLNEPRPEPEPAPKKSPRKPRAAPKAQAPAPPPIPQTPLQVAASMLEILRLEQAERQYRRGEMYKSWVK